MQLLSTVAIVCCAVLVLGIATLWWKLHQMHAARPVVTARKHPVRERRVHPRLDLAAGSVPRAQTVRVRQRGQGLQRQHGQSPMELPLRQRPDRAYFNPSFGDLRDPDPGQAPAGGVLRPTGSLGKRER